MRDYSFRGEGTTGRGVLLVHGLTGAPGEMKFLARRLQRQGFSVACNLLPGHGVDEKTLLRSTWRQWLDGVRSDFETYSRDWDVGFVAGICMGGALGLALAAENRKVKGVAAYSQTYRYDGWNMKGWYARVVPLMRPFANLPLIRDMSFEEPYPFGLKDEQLRANVANAEAPLIPGAISRIPMGAMFHEHMLSDHVDRIARKIRQPVLIVHSTEDDMAHPRNAERLQRSLGGPSELVLVDDCYHMVHVDKRRNDVGDKTAEFFNRVADKIAPLPQVAEAANG